MSVEDRQLDVYMIAIGGTGMAPLACLLQNLGHRVRGSDGPLYPPMSTLLESADIEPLLGHQVSNVPTCDLVIVGNTIRADNPEVERARQLDIPLLSMPEALRRFFLDDRSPLVVAGTHGKTTTSSLAAWALVECGQDPGYLIGGVPTNLARSFAIGGGDRFVVEGDEYGCSFFDRGPKFLHYQPQTLILTSVEYDHADLYPDHESLLSAYRKLVALLPKEGLLIACGDSEEVRAVASLAACRVLFYGLRDENELSPDGEVTLGPEGSSMTIVDAEAGAIELRLSLPGLHNASNALAVWAALRADGISARRSQNAIASFSGAKRRLEEIGTFGGVTIVDDFAHHPTAVEASLGALRARAPKRRLIALFEPRTLSAGRKMFFDSYVTAFSAADVVLLAPVFHRGRLRPEECLDRSRLCREIHRKHGIDARSVEAVDELLEETLGLAKEGDVVVTMSSGSFEALPRRLASALEGSGRK